jgi:ABC-type Fe3+/spermidine/putrescine transport system ATPase subunit
VRPEAIRLVEPSRGVTDATVGARRFLGATALFVVETDHGTVLEVTADPHAVRTGDRVGLSFTGIGVHVFPAASA